MAISGRKLSHKYLLDFMIRSYRNKGAKDADILHFIAIGELNKEDFEEITGKPYPEDTNSTPSSAGSNTSDSKGNSSSASSSTGSAGSTASSSSSGSGATSKDNSSKGSTTTEKSNDSK